MWRLLAVGLVACQPSWNMNPPPARPRAHAPPANQNVELVARCATEAVEVLGWNPVPDGADQGMVIETAIAHGASADCAPLAIEANASNFTVGGDVIDWDWEPKAQPDATTIRFIFTCAGCTPVETHVVLPRRWYCFGWLEGAHNGTYCYQDPAACEAEHSGMPSTPCRLYTGSAWCQRGSPTTCSSSPWSCEDNPHHTRCDRAP
jgi:hypothetical protein